MTAALAEAAGEGAQSARRLAAGAATVEELAALVAGFDLAVPGLHRPVPTLPTFHPSFLLRTPERKRETWRDLRALRARLDELLASETVGNAQIEEK